MQTTPYDQLLRKHHSASSVVYDDLINAPYDPSYSVSEKFGNFAVPDKVMAKALSKTARNHTLMNLNCHSVSELSQHPKYKKEYIVNRNVADDSSFRRPLNKQKVHELLNPKDAYINKWQNMLQARDAEKSFLKFKNDQQSIKSILQGTIAFNRR